VSQSDQPSREMPVLFVGHGSPMNAIEDNRWSRGFRDLAADLPAPPVAYLAVSAHWYVAGTYLTGNERPRTIHDFGGFPRELFEVQYPARGDVDLAERVTRLLADRRAALREDWGLDHGTWSVMRHMVPDAAVPVVQLSIDRRLTPADHLAIGRALAPLREQGVVILASGNITHNLRHALPFLGRPAAPAPPWATAFDAEIARALDQRDSAFLVRALETDDGRLSHPTPDHYFPLLYAAGAAGDAAEVTFPIEGFDGSSISMRAVRFA
jgi:4,5-DOPA dioxygenase extradiol